MTGAEGSAGEGPAAFVVPRVIDNDDGWGPCDVPAQFKDIPYAPFGKGDKLGKAADWQSQGFNKFQGGRFQGSGNVINTAFSFFHNEEEENFHLVDSRPIQRPKFGPRRFQPGQRFPRRDQAQAVSGRDAGGGAERERRRREQKQQKANQYQFNDWRNQQRVVLAASIDVRPEWPMLEQIPLSALTKLGFEVGEPTDLVTAGTLEHFDKSLDRVTPRTAVDLKRSDRRVVPQATTSSDPILARLAAADAATVFATDGILSAIMCASRSVYSWDVMATKQGGKLFLDKRDRSPIDMLTVSETAQEPMTQEKDAINGAPLLSQEATAVNQAFSLQACAPAAGRRRAFDEPNPFGPPPGKAGPEVAPFAYRYRKWVLDEEVSLVARCELHGLADNKGQEQLITLKALNEFDPSVTGVDWRQKIENQRGAVLATELKNNANKLAKWTAQALLAGADTMKVGYVSRVHRRDNSAHTLLATQGYKPKELAAQINLSVHNMWGVLKSIIDLLLKREDGKYLLLKDPNKPQLLLYRVPPDAFAEEFSEEPLPEGEREELPGGGRDKPAEDADDA